MARTATRVELYLRSLAQPSAGLEQDAIVRRLRSLAAQDRLGEFEVVVCGDGVCPDDAAAETDRGRRLLDRYESFRAWAADRDRSLVGFRELAVDSTIRETTLTGVAFPRIALAEYRGEDLTFVAPSRDASDATTVSDRVATIAGAGADGDDARDRASWQDGDAARD